MSGFATGIPRNRSRQLRPGCEKFASAPADCMGTRHRTPIANSSRKEDSHRAPIPMDIPLPKTLWGGMQIMERRMASWTALFKWMPVPPGHCLRTGRRLAESHDSRLQGPCR